MARTVTARTLNLFTAAEGAAHTFAETTVMLVAMTSAQVAAWKWIGEGGIGTDPVEGWEVRDREGALLGVVLPLGHRAGAVHAEWYDPQADDFFPAGETGAPVLTQAVARVIEERRRHVAELPAGRDYALDPVRYSKRPGACIWLYCFDPECPSHGPTRAAAA